MAAQGDRFKRLGRESAELRCLKLAVQVLERMVRDEHPPSYTLAEIVRIWGNGSPEEVEAIRRLER
jgi:hypothetical protein